MGTAVSYIRLYVRTSKYTRQIPMMVDVNKNYTRGLHFLRQML